MKRKFVAEPDWIDVLGWHLQSVHEFDPRRGEGLAHDTMEHKPHTNVTMTEELMALGTSLLTREDTSEYFGEMLRDTWILLLPTVPPIHEVDKVEAIDPRILKMVSYLKGTKLDENQIDNVRRWLEHGLHYAKQRYAGESLQTIRDDFQYLWDAGDHYINLAKPGDYLLIEPTKGGRPHVEFHQIS